MFTVQFDCVGLRFQHCFEGSIVFTRITDILISLFLEIPSVLWFVLDTVDSQSSQTFLNIFSTHWTRSKKSCVQTYIFFASYFEA